MKKAGILAAASVATASSSVSLCSGSDLRAGAVPPSHSEDSSSLSSAKEAGSGSRRGGDQSDRFAPRFTDFLLCTSRALLLSKAKSFNVFKQKSPIAALYLCWPNRSPKLPWHLHQTAAAETLQLKPLLSAINAAFCCSYSLEPVVMAESFNNSKLQAPSSLMKSSCCKD